MHSPSGKKTPKPLRAGAPRGSRSTQLPDRAIGDDEFDLPVTELFGLHTFVGYA